MRSKRRRRRCDSGIIAKAVGDLLDGWRGEGVEIFEDEADGGEIGAVFHVRIIDWLDFIPVSLLLLLAEFSQDRADFGNFRGYKFTQFIA